MLTVAFIIVKAENAIKQGETLLMSAIILPFYYDHQPPSLKSGKGVQFISIDLKQLFLP